MKIMQLLSVELNEKLMLNSLPFKNFFCFVVCERHVDEIYHQKVPGEVYVTTDRSFYGQDNYLKPMP